ncbi:hypothetical protein [Pseudodesulfovibrio piezophilus]|uniref:Uncharacterized protein n=1 Tax=Pseudodesulfovibrio piezophilus (strain DSM 21447 / JCM 15486 / C1TLV30) TaxID=1322246 RepID=M1WVJ2_PSEP2|nr:hypothetical protein [Pseudodesulfovibrio piezophilus]CCH48503.1 membrane protein of unknown function [Pseudodesulfovibrio piezophilus C1TLV30]
MTNSRKFTWFFALGIASIASVYATAIHLWLEDASHSASVSAILGSLVLSYAIWLWLHEKRGAKAFSGVVLGGLCGCLALILGPLGFGIEDLLIGPSKELVLSELVYIPLISIASFPLIFLVMHGWAVVLAGVLLGGVIEQLEHRSSEKNEGKG